MFLLIGRNLQNVKLEDKLYLTRKPWIKNWKTLQLKT